MIGRTVTTMAAILGNVLIGAHQPRRRRQAQTASSATATTSQTIHWISWRPRFTITRGVDTPEGVADDIMTDAAGCPELLVPAVR